MALVAPDRLDLVSSHCEDWPIADCPLHHLQSSEAEALAMFQASLCDKFTLPPPIYLMDLVSSHCDGHPSADHPHPHFPSSGAEALALFKTTLDERCPRPAPIVNFDEEDLLSLFIKGKSVSLMGGKLNKLRKKNSQKEIPTAASKASIDFDDDTDLLAALKNSNMSAREIKRYRETFWVFCAS